METPFSAGHSAPLPDSLWAATTDSLPRYPALPGTVRTYVTVIGAGFMGLATALSLAENGVNVALIEAAEVGWGASGRNNGLLAPGLKRDPHDTGAMRKLLKATVDLGREGHAKKLVTELLIGKRGDVRAVLPVANLAAQVGLADVAAELYQTAYAVATDGASRHRILALWSSLELDAAGR